VAAARGQLRLAACKHLLTRLELGTRVDRMRLRFGELRLALAHTQLESPNAVLLLTNLGGGSLSILRVALDLLELRLDLLRTRGQLEVASGQLGRLCGEALGLLAALGGQLGLALLQHLLARLDLHAGLHRVLLHGGELLLAVREAVLEGARLLLAAAGLFLRLLERADEPLVPLLRLLPRRLDLV